MDTTKLNANQITIDFPAVTTERLEIEMDACQLEIKPGEGSAWVSGSYEDPTGLLPLEIQQQGGVARIVQHVRGWDLFTVPAQPARCTLLLGKAQPYTLQIKSGANESYYDLGGLPLTGLQIKQGAGKLQLDFPLPNPQQMTRLELTAGASSVEAYNLANADFVELAVEGGAASYKLAFADALRHDATAYIKTGMAGIEIAIPAEMAARVVCHTVLGGVEAAAGFVQREDAYWTVAALQGVTPLLTVQANVVLGGVKLLSSADVTAPAGRART